MEPSRFHFLLFFFLFYFSFFVALFRDGFPCPFLFFFIKMDPSREGTPLDASFSFLSSFLTFVLPFHYPSWLSLFLGLGLPPSGLFAAAFAAVRVVFTAAAAAAFATGCGPPTVETPNLAAFDLRKCQERLENC